MTDIPLNNRILVVDDNTSIHEDFQKILPATADDHATDVNALINEVLGKTSADGDVPVEGRGSKGAQVNTGTGKTAQRKRKDAKKA